MLIVPVVEGLNWRRPPPVTLALIVLNCLVFFLYQAGDSAREERALRAYAESTLPALEMPAFEARLREKNPQLAERASNAPPQALVGLMESDEDFMRDLHAGLIVKPEHPKYAQWRADRARFEGLLAEVSYRKYGFTPAKPSVLTAFTSMFLHGSLMHLVGNMVFLFIVGVAVESAMGGSWYALLYVATGLAGDGLHMLVHPGSPVPSVGASGAISGLMGLFTVVFGLREVNFFYWLVFFFGFKPLRGIVVLPVWIAWELVQFFANRGSHVGYMAHAGGLISGALLGFVVMKRFSGRRVEAFHEQRAQEAFDKAEYERARTLAAKLDFKGAGTVFARLAERFPAEAELMKQWYAVAKSDPASDSFHGAVNHIMALPRPDAATRAFQRQVFADYLARAKPQPRFDPHALAAGGLVFARAGDIDDAERVAEILLKLAPAEPRLLALWEALAAALGESPGDGEKLRKAKRYRAMIGAQARAKRSPVAPA